jgi:cyclopropane fatty-acyl-phospholipid synthase-like methyltransferase
MVDRSTFQMAYGERSAPWDIDRAQKAFVEVADRIAGAVLDAGCGTGENALFLASLGRRVTGIDFLEGPIRQARRKASERGLAVDFLVKDALTLSDWAERFDSIVDSGLFHVFGDDDRAKYVEGLAAVLRPGGRLFLLCFSDEQPGTMGPRRVAKGELEASFSRDFTIESIERGDFEVRPDARQERFSGSNPKAWFLVAVRTGGT